MNQEGKKYINFCLKFLESDPMLVTRKKMIYIRMALEMINGRPSGKYTREYSDKKYV